MKEEDIIIRADNVEMIVQVWEGGLQAGAHSKPGFPVDGFGNRAAELKIVCEQGLGIVEIALLNGIHQGLYNFSLVHGIFLYYYRAVSEQMGLGIKGCSLWDIHRFPQNDKHIVY